MREGGRDRRKNISRLETRERGKERDHALAEQCVRLDMIMPILVAAVFAHIFCSEKRGQIIVGDVRE